MITFITIGVMIVIQPLVLVWPAVALSVMKNILVLMFAKLVRCFEDRLMGTEGQHDIIAFEWH